MDLVDYSEQVYENIKADYAKIAENLGLTQVTYFPISALKGDNIVTRSADMDWYNGVSLLEYLEEVEVNTDTDTNSRFQVQYVIRPQNMKYFADSYENNEQGERPFDELHDYRGYAGKILSGDFRKGDRIQILPTEISTKIDRIEINGSEVEEAFEGQSVVLHIEDDIDVSRGDFLYQQSNCHK